MASGLHSYKSRRKPAQGDHVASGLHSYESKLCSLWMKFTPHAKPSVYAPRNLGNLLFLFKLYFIEILFGVSLSVTSSLSCPEAKTVELIPEEGETQRDKVETRGGGMLGQGRGEITHRPSIHCSFVLLICSFHTHTHTLPHPRSLVFHPGR